MNLADATAVFNYNAADDTGTDSDRPNSTADRFDALKSGGIPAQVVFIPPGKILKPDLTIADTPGSNRATTLSVAASFAGAHLPAQGLGTRRGHAQAVTEMPRVDPDLRRLGVTTDPRQAFVPGGAQTGPLRQHRTA